MDTQTLVLDSTSWLPWALLSRRLLCYSTVCFSDQSCNLAWASFSLWSLFPIPCSGRHMGNDHTFLYCGPERTCSFFLRHNPPFPRQRFWLDHLGQMSTVVQSAVGQAVCIPLYKHSCQPHEGKAGEPVSRMWRWDQLIQQKSTLQMHQTVLTSNLLWWVKVTFSHKR